MVLHRGNVDAIYPNAPEAKARKAKGSFTDAPFLAETKVVSLPAKPKFAGAGDFDADGHGDVAIAAEEQNALYWLPGDGKGGFGTPRKIVLPGRATAFVTGEVNRRDGLTDIVLGVTGPASHQLLVFEGPEGALAREPEVFPLPATATSLVLDRLDEEYPVDLAIAAGSQLLVIHGRDRKLSLDEGQRAKVQPAIVDRIPLSFSVASIASGNFDNEGGRDLALLSEEGDLYHIQIHSLLKAVRQGTSLVDALGEPRLRGSGAKEMVRTKSSSLPGDDLLLVDRKNRKLDLVMAGSGSTEPTRAGVDRADHELSATPPGTALSSTPPPRLAALEARGDPVAVLPLRMRPRALNELVVLADGPESLSVVPTGPATVIPVNSVADPGDGTCNPSECTLREAITTANGNPGPDSISFGIAGAGPHVIEPVTPLPLIIESVDIEGETQPGWAGTPVVVIDGSSATLIDPDAVGLKVEGGFTTISELSIINFGTAAIHCGIIPTACVIVGNYLGVDPTGAAGPNGSGVLLDNDANGSVVGGTVPDGRNIISSNVYDGIGIGYVPGHVSVADIFIQGNFIGLSPSGVPVGNGVFGIAVASSNVQIGGTDPGQLNVISFNHHGITVAGDLVEGALIQGNFIGTFQNALGCAGNRHKGIHAGNIGAGSITIGGTTPAARNVTSCNVEAGIWVEDSPGILVQGNYAGLGLAGGTPLPNNEGIRLLNTSSTTIGGTTPGARNIISGNTQAGVNIAGGELNTVAGNFIGTDVNGNSPVPNLTGVAITAGALNNVIGVASGGNVISGNTREGVLIFDATANWVSNNLIGLAADGTSPLGNGRDGVQIDEATANLVGGVSPSFQNTIAFNGRSGIQIIDLPGAATGNGFLVNSIFDNLGLGIDLGPFGVTINDPQDHDVGPNNLQNYPELTSALSTGGSLELEGILDSTLDHSFTIRVYSSPICDPSGHGEGKTYLGSFVTSTNASGLATFSETLTAAVSTGQAITATASDSGETSEFSGCASTAGIPPRPVSGVIINNNGPPPTPEAISWDPAPGATTYHLYAGTELTVAGLASQAGDSCQALVLPATGFPFPPASNPPPGHLLWMLVTAEGPYGEGTVQPGTNGPRVLTSTGECGDSCAHDRCDVGGPLVPTCDLCASIVCDKDPACCSTAWTAACVQQVRTVCRNLACPESQGQCAHDLCDSGGGPLVAGCDKPPLPVSCTAAICQVDPFCCQTAWDDICVGEVASVCGYNCL